ncbi:MAG: universal stress protein [Pirellulaceae bacterium]
MQVANDLATRGGPSCWSATCGVCTDLRCYGIACQPANLKLCSNSIASNIARVSKLLLSAHDLHVGGPSARMLEGEPSEAIPELCKQEQADLLICGTVARQGIPGLLLGNTAERIVNRVGCSILAVTPTS